MSLGEFEPDLAPGLPIEVRCDIQGLALGLLGETVWADGPGGGFHGVVITGFPSGEGALPSPVSRAPGACRTEPPGTPLAGAGKATRNTLRPPGQPERRHRR